MKNLLDLTGKKALVTGGSRGIGNRLARALHEAGAEVVIFYNHTCPDGLAQEMQGDGPAVHAVQCDVADRSSLERGVKAAADRLGGRIDILINAAGINRRYWLEDFPTKDWDEVMNINVNGAVYCTQLVGKYMLAGGFQADHRHHLPLLCGVAKGPQPPHRPRCGGRPDHHGVRHRHAGGPGLDHPGDRPTPENIGQYGQNPHLRGHAEAECAKPEGPQTVHALIGGRLPRKGLGVTHFDPPNG